MAEHKKFRDDDDVVVAASQDCIFDSSNAVLGMAFMHPPKKKGDSILYCRDELCTA
jgi:hypothetical protein